MSRADRSFLVRLRLKSSDEDHVRNFAQRTGSNAPVTVSRLGYCTGGYFDRELVSALAKWGIVPKKTFTISFPYDLPAHLHAAFVRVLPVLTARVNVALFAEYLYTDATVWLRVRGKVFADLNGLFLPEAAASIGVSRFHRAANGNRVTKSHRTLVAIKRLAIKQLTRVASTHTRPKSAFRGHIEWLCDHAYPSFVPTATRVVSVETGYSRAEAMQNQYTHSEILRREGLNVFA